MCLLLPGQYFLFVCMTTIASAFTSCMQDDQKAEDELAKKRAAFLLKQQRKAEEARIRKQQLEVESELKRDEARYQSRWIY